MTVNTVSEVQTIQKEPEGEQRIFSFKVSQVVWLLLSIYEAVLALRFVSKLIADKPVSPIVGLLYGATGLFRVLAFKLW